MPKPESRLADKEQLAGCASAAGSMQFIAADLVDAAMNRLPDLMVDRQQPLVMGVTVARFGDGSSVIAMRRGRNARAWRIDKDRFLDLMTLASCVMERAMVEGVKGIFVDEDGLGTVVVNRLRKLGAPFVVGVNFASAAEHRSIEGTVSLYANKGTEIWARLRDWLKDGCLPPDPDLRSDLVGIEYVYNANGEIQLEKKEDMKKRCFISPDIGRALALTFAELGTSFAWDLETPVHIFYNAKHGLYAERDGKNDDDAL